MSAEMENGKEEETKEPLPKKTAKERCLEYWQIGIKILEIVLCCVCYGPAYDAVRVTSLGQKLHHVGIMYTAYTGYMLINLVLLTGHILKERLGYKTSALFSVAGSILFLTTGTLLIADRAELHSNSIFYPHQHLLEYLLWSGLFAFATAAVFAVDAVFTFIRRMEF